MLKLDFCSFLKDNCDGRAKNLSALGLWTIAFVNGNDTADLMRRNFEGVIKAIFAKDGVRMRGKMVRVVMPCDMASHNDLVVTEHLKCFRCLWHLSEMRTMFVVVEGGGRTLAEIAAQQRAHLKTLQAVNVGADGVEFVRCENTCSLSP